MEEIDNLITDNEKPDTPSKELNLEDIRGAKGASGDPIGIDSEIDPQPDPPAESIQKLLNDVIKDYETKFNDLKTSTEKAIAERDDMIRSLLNGDKPRLSVADKINAQRNFKKW